MHRHDVGIVLSTIATAHKGKLRVGALPLSDVTPEPRAASDEPSDRLDATAQVRVIRDGNAAGRDGGGNGGEGNGARTSAVG